MLARGEGNSGFLFAHRIAWELQVGPIPIGMQVLHQCDNPACVRVHPDHLHLGTQRDNIREAVERGRNRGASGDANIARKAPWKFRGERNGRAKLTEAQVAAIRERYAAGGITQQRLADEYGVSQVLISLIVRRASWTYCD